MEPTNDVKTILEFLKEFGVGSVPEISFCTLIQEWRVEIDVQDMGDEGWLELSTNDQEHTVARIKQS